MAESKLKIFLTTNGFSQAELARSAQVSERTIGRLVKGDSNHAKKTKYQVLRGLNRLLKAQEIAEVEYADVFDDINDEDVNGEKEEGSDEK